MPDLLSTAPDLLARLFVALDRRDYDTLVNCFAPDGTWMRQGKTLQGRAEIAKVLTESRPATLTTAHVVTNVCVDRLSDSEAKARFYLAVYRHDSMGKPPYPVPAPTVLGMCEAELVRSGSQWRLRHLQTGPYVFSG